MTIDIIVPVFNELDKTTLFINSLANQIKNRLIIIDNGSDEITHSYLKTVNAHLITNDANLGYTRGMNQGLAQVESEFVLFSNNDVILPAHLLQRMLKHFDNYDIIAPLTNKSSVSAPDDNPLLIDFNPEADDIEKFSQNLYFKNKMRSLPITRAYGHCLLMKREALDKVGFLDESFESGYHSDDDFCRRAIDHNMKIGLALDCFIFHFCHTTFSSLGIDSKIEMEKSQIIFEAKYK